MASLLVPLLLAGGVVAGTVYLGRKAAAAAQPPAPPPPLPPPVAPRPTPAGPVDPGAPFQNLPGFLGDVVPNVSAGAYWHPGIRPGHPYGRFSPLLHRRPYYGRRW